MIITNLDQVTPEWLTEVLHRAGALSQGCVATVEKRALPTNTAVIAFLDLTYSDDAPAAAPKRLFFKASDRRREVDFYNVIVPAMTDPSVPLCYEAGFSDEQVRSHMLLEDLSRAYLRSHEALPPSRPRYEGMIDVLADFHAQWWGHPRLAGDMSELASDLRGFVIRMASDSFPGFVDFLGDRLSDERRALYEKLFTNWPPGYMAGRLTSYQNMTIIHGDAHVFNFLSPREPEQKRVKILDWAMWQISLGTDDLAYMIAMHDFPEYRARMEKPLLQHYHEKLLEHGVSGYDWDQCWLDYRTSAISNLFWPVFHWSVQGDPALWWPNLEKALMAFDDLHCVDLLAG